MNDLGKIKYNTTNWNSIPDSDRLRMWKNLRTDIATLSIQDQLAEVAKFFAHIPYGSRSIDYYSPESWPSPWEIIFHGKLCKSSISLLIFHTLTILHTENTVELHLVDDGADEYLLPVINNTFVLNYELGEVNNLQNIAAELQIKNTFTDKDIKQIT